MKRAGRKQAAFTAGELAGSVWERDDYKYFWAGLREAVNVDVTPQGGLVIRPGLRRRAIVSGTAARLYAFTASNGAAYDLVASAGAFDVYQGATLRATVAHGYTAGHLRDLAMAQLLDTGILTHPDVPVLRLKHIGATSWALDAAPLVGLPLYDYGGVYTNGRPAEWDIELIGWTEGSVTGGAIVWTVTVSGSETQSLRHGGDGAATAAALQDAILALPNVSPGVTVTAHETYRFRVTFGGVGNVGDKWAVSGRAVNKADAAVVSSKVTVGAEAGEPIVSNGRGWPRTATFYQQRLLLGGLRSLPNTYLVSRSGDYYNFDDRLDTASGPFVVPMDTPGGEAIVRIISGRDLIILTTEAEYSIADRALSKTSPPVHVEAGRNGARARAVAENEGAILFAFSEGGGVGELRWTDANGNYVVGDIGLLAPHLVSDVADLAVRGKTGSQQGNRIALVRDDGHLVLGTLLRDQEVTAYAQVAGDATYLATSCNGANELSVLTDRPAGGGRRRALEVLEQGLLLDDAIALAFNPASSVIAGLEAYEGIELWAIAGANVHGPYRVAGGVITLPAPVQEVTIGRWQPPRISTLPLSRTVGPKIVALARGRIHTVHLQLEDTTSVAIAVNGGPARDVPLLRTADIAAGGPELVQSFSGRRTLRNLKGWVDDPYVTITQVRPGRLTLKSIVVEAAL